MERRSFLAAALLLAACAALPAQAPAQAPAQPQTASPPLPDRRDMLEVERRVQEAAAYGIPRTVAIRVEGPGTAGVGSGAIISPDGIVLTCAHVVEPEGDLEVMTSDGAIHRAERLGRCSVNDYALVRFQGEGLPCFPLLADVQPVLGDWVLALGHPGGPYPDQQPSLSVGRVTGLHKRIPMSLTRKYYHDAIRLDCPIYSGSSGGPLLDLEGRLVGIAGAVFLATDDAYGVPASAVASQVEFMAAGQDVEGVTPEDMAAVLDELERDLDPATWDRLFGDASPVGRILHRLLGPDWRRELGMEAPRERPDDPGSGKSGEAGQGPGLLAAEPGTLGIMVREDVIQGRTAVLVETVLPGSAAQAAGLEAGDRLLRVDGRDVATEDDFAAAMSGRRAGETLALEVLRGDAPRTFTARLAARTPPRREE